MTVITVEQVSRVYRLTEKAPGLGGALRALLLLIGYRFRLAG